MQILWTLRSGLKCTQKCMVILAAVQASNHLSHICTGVFSAVTPPSMGGNAFGGSPRFSQNGQFTLLPRVMGDGKHHKLHSCPKFKKLSVQERLAKVNKHGLCFRRFGRHWANKCKI